MQHIHAVCIRFDPENDPAGDCFFQRGHQNIRRIERGRIRVEEMLIHRLAVRKMFTDHVVAAKIFQIGVGFRIDRGLVIDGADHRNRGALTHNIILRGPGNDGVADKHRTARSISLHTDPGLTDDRGVQHNGVGRSHICGALPLDRNIAGIVQERAVQHIHGAGVVHQHRAAVAREHAGIDRNGLAAVIDHIISRVAGETGITHIQRTVQHIDRTAVRGGFVVEEFGIRDRELAVFIVDRTGILRRNVALKGGSGDGQRAAVADRRAVGKSRIFLVRGIAAEKGIFHHQRAAVVNRTAPRDGGVGHIGVVQQGDRLQGQAAAVQDRTAVAAAYKPFLKRQILQRHRVAGADAHDPGPGVVSRTGSGHAAVHHNLAGGNGAVDGQAVCAKGVVCEDKRTEGAVQIDLKNGVDELDRVRSGRRVKAVSGEGADRDRTCLQSGGIFLCILERFPQRDHTVVHILHILIGGNGQGGDFRADRDIIERISPALEDFRTFFFQGVETVDRISVRIHILGGAVNRGGCAQTVSGGGIRGQCHIFHRAGSVIHLINGAVRIVPDAVLCVVEDLADLPDQHAGTGCLSVGLNGKRIAVPISGKSLITKDIRLRGNHIVCTGSGGGFRQNNAVQGYAGFDQCRAVNITGGIECTDAFGSHRVDVRGCTQYNIIEKGRRLPGEMHPVGRAGVSGDHRIEEGAGSVPGETDYRGIRAGHGVVVDLHIAEDRLHVVRDGMVDNMRTEGVIPDQHIIHHKGGGVV